MKTKIQLLVLSLMLLSNVGCKRDLKDDRKDSSQEKTHAISEIEKVNFYLENSGSMDGYTREGYTDFEKAISKLLTNLIREVNKDSLQIILANNEQYPWDGSYEDFLEEVVQKGIPKIGDVSESDINNIFKNILNSTEEDQVSTMVTDAIYSVEPDKCEDLIGLLDTKGRFTGNHFYDRVSSSDLSTLIIKLQSDFNGYYYPAEGGSVVINHPRPYYLWFFGNSYHLKKLYDKLDIQELPGYQNDQFFLKSNKIDLVYSILEYGEDSGIIGKYEPTDAHRYPIHSINYDSRANYGEFQGSFGFGILVDLKDVPLPEKYLTDPANYFSSSEEYEVYEIRNLKEIEDQDTLMDIANQESESKNQYTHVVYVKTSSKFVQNISIGIRNQISTWITESSNDCDSNIEGDTNTTFGLQQLSSGIIRAYEEASPSPELIILDIAIKA